MPEDKNQLKTQSFDVSIPTDLVIQADLKPWQVMNLAINVASKLDNTSNFQTPEMDRNPRGYTLTLHEEMGQEFLRLVEDAKRYYADKTDIPGYPTDYQNNPMLTIRVPNAHTTGVITFWQSPLKPESIRKTPRVVIEILQAYLGSPDHFQNMELEDAKKVYGALYNMISGIMRTK